MKPTKRFYQFGSFRLDPTERTLAKEGKPVPLTPKAFGILGYLVENHGHIVEREELMKQIWPNAYVEEANLTVNIFALRKILSEGADAARFIETIPKRGYRFVAPVEELDSGSEGQAPVKRDYLPASSDSTLSSGAEELQIVAGPAKRRSMQMAGLLLAGLAVVTTAVITWALIPPPVPRSVRTVQITRYGRAASQGRIVSDGVRLYFTEVNGGHTTLAQAAVDGGDAVPLPTPFPNTVLHAISPDHSELLVSSSVGLEADRPLWLLPLPGGRPRRLGDISASDGAWSPDGQKIAYTSGSGVYLVNSDGSGAHRLAATAGSPERVRWSPNGRILRFTVSSPMEALSLWEVGADGRDLHPLLPGWADPLSVWGEGQCCGEWTADGGYYVFRSSLRAASGDHTPTMWAKSEIDTLLHPARGRLTPLYSGPLAFWDLAPRADGKRIYFIGNQPHQELVRYDRRSGQFLPYLGGRSVMWASFSRDGLWVAYLTAPDRVLWRSKTDGSQRLQLTFPPAQIFNPTWSPDGKRIAFCAIEPGKTGKIQLVSVDGGNAADVNTEKYTANDPSWFPDGNALLFRGLMSRFGEPEGQARTYRLDLKSGRISALPGSEDLAGPSLSPDGRYIAAIPADNKTIMLFDFKTQKWKVLAQGSALSARCWSRDSKYIYYQDYLEGVEQPIFRVQISTGQVDRITTSAQIPRSDIVTYSFAGLAPDDSPLAMLHRSSADIYALDVDLP